MDAIMSGDAEDGLSTSARIEELRDRVRRSFEEYVEAEQALGEAEDGSFRVCIFGSARIKSEDPIYQMVRTLACTLARLGIDVVTGGGPGLMEAANLGEKDAHAAGVLSIGLPILLPHRRELANKHLDIKMEHRRFSSRLDEFMRLSHAVIVAPGGIGTLLELSYVWQLVQVELIAPRTIVLLGRDFWGGLLGWMRYQQSRRGFIRPSDMHIVHSADTEAEVLDFIRPELERFRAQKREAGLHPTADHADRILQHVERLQKERVRHERLPGTRE